MNRSRSSSRSCGSGDYGGDVKSTQRQSSFRDFDSDSPDRASVSEYYYDRSFRHLPASNNSTSPGIADNGIVGSDASRRFQLPFQSHAQAQATVTSSPRPRHYNYKKPHSDYNTLPLPPLPSRSPHHNANNSHLARRNAYSKGINLNNLQPPPRRRRMLQNVQTAETVSYSSLPQSTSSGVSEVVSLRRSGQCPSTNERSVRDAAKSRLRKLCTEILQSAKEGKSPPPRAEIKEAVVGYHRSRNNAISPRDPNFTEIPPEFSQVLTYGIARSQAQTAQQASPVIEESEQQLYNDMNHQQQQTVVKSRARARRSRFSEIKDEGQDVNESLLHSTMELGPSDMVSCVSLPSSIRSKYYHT